MLCFPFYALVLFLGSLKFRNWSLLALWVSSRLILSLTSSALSSTCLPSWYWPEISLHFYRSKSANALKSEKHTPWHIYSTGIQCNTGVHWVHWVHCTNLYLWLSSLLAASRSSPSIHIEKSGCLGARWVGETKTSKVYLHLAGSTASHVQARIPARVVSLWTRHRTFSAAWLFQRLSC